MRCAALELVTEASLVHAVAVNFARFALFLGLSMAWPLFSALSADDRSANPVEVGKVAWGRDLDAALAESEESGKPVLLLFQEAPG